jgi:hypothetical protein
LKQPWFSCDVTQIDGKFKQASAQAKCFVRETALNQNNQRTTEHKSFSNTFSRDHIKGVIVQAASINLQIIDVFLKRIYERNRRFEGESRVILDCLVHQSKILRVIARCSFESGFLLTSSRSAILGFDMDAEHATSLPKLMDVLLPGNALLGSDAAGLDAKSSGHSSKD